MSTHEITFHLQETEHDRQQAVEFAYKMAHHWYQCHPSDTPQYIFSAKENNLVVSIVGVTEYNPDKIFPILTMYDIDLSYLPSDWNWRNITQISWFFSVKKECSASVFLMALEFCHAANKNYAILQMKEKIFNILSKKGFKLIRIENAKLLINHIDEEDKGYYLDANPIYLYFLDVSKNVTSIQTYISTNQLVNHSNNQFIDNDYLPKRCIGI